MAETTRFLPDQQLDLRQILKEAAHRWLRPAEICEILHNHQRFQITPDPPNRPPAGSLFLVDRKALRYFRKDGHRWRKKKDGKTVKEAHEKLKSGSVDVLHCYYAHGEENQNFQRRSYWMLDQQLQHIVLVHYRDVKEEYNSGISLLPSQGSQVGSPLSSSTPSSAQTYSPVTTLQTSFASNPNRSYWNGQTTSSAVEDVDSGGNLGDSFLTQPGFVSLSSNASLPSQKIAESSRNPLGSWYPKQKSYPGAADSSVWNGIHSSIRNADGMVDKKYCVEQASGADFFTHKLTHDRLIPDIDIQEAATVSKIDTQVQPIIATEKSSKPQIVGTFDELVKNENKIKVEDVAPSNEESGGLKKLDSFGRWMDEEIGVHCDDSLMASDSANFWNTLDAEKDDKEVSSLSRHMQLDVESLGPSLSQEQLFSICDFSPDWAYSDDGRKVLIAGRFLGSKKHSDDSKWGCMFGEIEVSAEVLTDNVIRCRTPSHAPGRVPFYVTCRNRLACSEVRDFEFREKPLGIAITPKEEVRFQIRLGKLLNLGPERKYLDCSVVDCEKCKLKSIIQSMMSRIEGTLPGDILMKRLLKDKVFEWLVCKIHEEGKGPHVLDDEGFGVIHLTAALGYDWALGPIVTAGTNPNFRDAHGRTGLHWASYFGREETVAALVKLGAAPGAVDDPTPTLPGGQTAADLASSRGHKGIAACLAKADLTDHLVILETNEELTDSLAERIAAESAAEAELEVVTSDLTVDNHVLKGSLAAVRKSAHAAALIQAAFRNRSFRERQLAKPRDDDPDVSLDLVALASSSNKVPRGGNYEDSLHSAAARIQKKYRGWKGKREFLKIRDRVVRLQARVRGNQVRKQYKKVVWSVSMLEKVILRWRRKGAGLKGFRVEKAVEDASSEVGKSDEYEYEFLRAGRRQKCVAVEKALTSVKEMVRYPEAREQYMRIVAKLGKLEMGDEGNIASQPVENQQKKSGLEEELDEFIRNH